MQQVYRSLPHEPAAAILVRDLLSIRYFLPPGGWHSYVAHDAARICDDAVSLRLPSNGNYTFEMDTGSLGRLSGVILESRLRTCLGYPDFRMPVILGAAWTEHMSEIATSSPTGWASRSLSSRRATRQSLRLCNSRLAGARTRIRMLCSASLSARQDRYQ